MKARADNAAWRRRATRRRARLAAALAAGAGLLLLVALPACAAQVDGSAAPSATAAGPAANQAFGPAPSSTAAASRGASGDDWRHVLQVVANLRADPPAEPIVCLLGGSAARESTVSDASWTAQIRADGGPAVAAYNLGSRNRTLAQDVALVKKLPRAQGIVYIGVNVGRFTSPRSSPTITLPDPVATLPPYAQHQYTRSQVKSAAKKKALLNEWLARRYPVFKANYATNLKTLGALVDACMRRGYEPVLLELPRDTAVIGSSLDVPIKRFTVDCKSLARKKGARWVSFVKAARLPDRDFYDLWHLVEPGREVWQGLLSEETVRLLEQFGMEGAGS